MKVFVIETIKFKQNIYIHFKLCDMWKKYFTERNQHSQIQ